MRVQIPAYTDRWMMGDRYGEVLRLVTKTRPGEVNIEGVDAPWCKVAVVKLDKSGKTVRVLFSDCEAV